MPMTAATMPGMALSACELTNSNRRGLDRLGALERRAGEAAVHIVAQRGPRRNKLENLDPKIKVEADHDVGRRKPFAEQPRTRGNRRFEHVKNPVKIAKSCCLLSDRYIGGLPEKGLLDTARREKQPSQIR